MRLRNKQTGEIVDVESLGHADSLKGKFGYQVTLSWKIGEHLDTCKTYDSLAELNSEWEDVPEEPKEYYFIRDDGSGVGYSPIGNSTVAKRREVIGNCFDNEEEAEKAVEKLKAWKRLRDKGFKFDGWNGTQIGSNISYVSEVYYEGCADDMDLLFGGEE